MIVRDFLLPLGFEVEEVANGSDCHQRAAELQPDLILMDLVMPLMDGFEATRQIRRSRQLQPVKVIAMSASVFEQSRQASRQAGCDDFLPKPIQLDMLLDILGTHLHLEWVYDTGSATEAPQPTDNRPWTVPPMQELAPLMPLAQKGHIMPLYEQIERIEQLDARYGRFADALRRHADAFDMKALCDTLRSHMESHS